ncbi:hypothetical protein Ahy_A09g043143 [Arachis hypogaea]|uniref:SWIM-type domain-containing protein n=1 Tax=Arachis hypogaea TaxID=3818 RepID=A0A445BHN5_ARAHY|nr:hypothetical protein Ahy_A09g043143 [Arachis hypogaea]
MLQIFIPPYICNKILNRSCTHKNFRKVQVSNSTFNKFAVTYNRVSAKVKCQYLLFESRGIFCYHSLSALSFERNVKKRHTHIKSSHDEPLLEPRSKRFDDLEFWLQKYL